MLDWAYGGLGIYAVTVELWRIPGEDTRFRHSYFGGLEGIVGPVAEARWRQFNRDILGGRGFIDWHPFDHPQLGRIEIGGWSPFFRRNPPASYLKDVCHRAALFSIYQALCTPRLALRDIEEVRQSGGDRVLRVVVANDGTFPTESRWARMHGLAGRIEVSLTGPDYEVTRSLGHLAGMAEQSILLPIPAFLKGRYQIEVRSRKGGIDRREIVLPPHSGILDKPFRQK